MLRAPARFVAPLALGLAVWAGVAAPSAQDRRSRLFPPEELGQLEGPDRDEWQQPERVMDALGIADGAHVADIGIGSGWFTVRLARRVGPNGRVFGEDVQPQMIDATRRRMEREGLRNVTLVLGRFDDPLLPAPVDAALLVGVYSQAKNFGTDMHAFLQNIRRGLKPGGRLGIVDFRPGVTGPGPDEGRLAPEPVIAEVQRTGLRLVRHETFLRYQYLLVFERPVA
jgi:ubiquinone/menaquinone biosynthesis C-methylase UbiE